MEPPQVAAQSGVFAIHANPRQPVSEDALGWKIKILGTAREEFREELLLFGIHEASLFSDLDSLTRSLNSGPYRPEGSEPAVEGSTCDGPRSLGSQTLQELGGR